MGWLNLQSGIKATEEEPEECEVSTSSLLLLNNKYALSCMFNSEISAVLAIMRRNVRWDGWYMSSGDDQLEQHSLIQSLTKVRKQVFMWEHQDWHNFNPIMYLQPFLDVIRSVEIGASVISVALSSVYKILTLDDVLDLNTMSTAMHLVIDTVASPFVVTNWSSEEVVLNKILQVLLACMKSKASVLLSNQHVCTIIETCFIVHQTTTKGEVLQLMVAHTLGELVRCIFLHLPRVEAESMKHSTGNGSSMVDENGAGNGRESRAYDLHLTMEPYRVPCMFKIFQLLCSLLDAVDPVGINPRSSSLVMDEDAPLFALGLINSAIELGGASFLKHPLLLNMIQDELFYSLILFGLSPSPLILSMVCSIALNLYHHLRVELKLQLEAFFSCVILRLAQSRYGASYQQQEVAMQALVDFCRESTFVVEMYANLDCDITCHNVFEDLANLLSRSAFPVNSPLSSVHILALDGLIAIIQGMAERIGNGSLGSEQAPVSLQEYSPFWMVKCDNYSDPNQWVPFVRRGKYIKRRLMIGVDQFNRDPKKGLEFLQWTHLLPEKHDPQSVACFFRYTAGLDKNLVGDFLGNHDEFSVQVLHEFAQTFDFQDMNLDTALRLFLETFKLPGESQKIQRVLEAFSERYYEQTSHILADKDAALVLSYSLIMLNTDLHNVKVKNKMTEEDFIRNNRRINGEKDLPREFLSELYYSIFKNEICTTPKQGAGFAEMTPSRWMDLMHKCKKTSPYIVADSRVYLDRDMFAIMSGPTIAAISVVFEHAEHDDVYRTCIDGLLNIANISAYHHLGDVLDDLVVSLCKFTTLLNSSSDEEHVLAFGDDMKARMATVSVFTIANRCGGYIRSGWRNIFDCILRLHKLGLLPTHAVTSDAADDSEVSSDPGQGKPLTSSLSTSHFPQMQEDFPLHCGRSQLTEKQLAAHQRTLQTIQKCHIDNIFTESKLLEDEPLLQLAQALILAGGRPQKGGGSPEDEDTAVFCLELLIAITLNNQDRNRLWQYVFEHIANIVQSTVMPCALVEKAVFGLLRICHRLLPYKENLVDDELLRCFELVLKLDNRVADAYCEQITQEVTRLVKANATHIRSEMCWGTITSLLSVKAPYPEVSESRFDALVFIMSEGTHLLPSNFIVCIDSARQFAECCVGELDRSIGALDLMAGSVGCLVKWARESKEDADIGKMWLGLVQGLRKVSLDQREEVRNHAISCLQKCLTEMDEVQLGHDLWLQCFNRVIFAMLDNLLGISKKEYGNMEGTLCIAMKLVIKVFLQLVSELSQLSTFIKLWVSVLGWMEKYMKVKIKGKSEKLQDVVKELLKNTLVEMMKRGILVERRALGTGGDSLWELTWSHVNNMYPSLQSQVFASAGIDEYVDATSAEPEPQPQPQPQPVASQC